MGWFIITAATVNVILEEAKPAATASDSAPVDVSRLLLKVGKITAVKKHPDADTLYVETVDLAEECPRTIVRGLVAHVPIDQVSLHMFAYMDKHFTTK